MFKKIINYLDILLTWIATILIKIYQKTFSPDESILKYRLQGRICLHIPHCSKFAMQILERYGFISGIHQIMERVTNCHPWNHQHYDPAYYKVVFIGSSQISVPFLEYLNTDKRVEVVGVITVLDKPKGRGLQPQPNIIKINAQQILGEDQIYTPNSLNLNKSEEARKCLNWLQGLEPDFLIVVAYGKIIPIEFLNIPKFGAVNVHASILPTYRGASPIQSAILHQDTETGITIMLMNAGMDEGDILALNKFKIPVSRTSQHLYSEVAQIGPKLLVDTIWSYGKGYLQAIPQNSSNATYCQKISKEDGLIDLFAHNLAMIYAKYKAYYLRPKIYFMWNSKRIIIEEIEIDEPKRVDNKNNLLLINGNFSLNPAVKTLKVKPENKKVMNWSDFLRGYGKHV